MTVALPRDCGQECQPGFLFKPLGWLARPVGKALLADPELFVLMFELQPYRMHLLALALAHQATEPSLDIIRLLLSASPDTVMAAAIDDRPLGLQRVLRVLPDAVMAPES